MNAITLHVLQDPRDTSSLPTIPICVRVREVSRGQAGCGSRTLDCVLSRAVMLTEGCTLALTHSMEFTSPESSSQSGQHHLYHNRVGMKRKKDRERETFAQSEAGELFQASRDLEVKV